MGKFMIRRVPTGVKFDLAAGNGSVIATSEVYETLAACRRGIASVRKNAEKANLEDLTEAGASAGNPKFQLYKDRAGEFRFRLTARNGNVIAVSEGYHSKAACLDGIASVRENAPAAGETEVNNP